MILARKARGTARLYLLSAIRAALNFRLTFREGGQGLLLREPVRSRPRS